MLSFVVNGGWSEYGDWGECVDGIQTRQRACDNPTPGDGAAYCLGDNAEAKLCIGNALSIRYYKGALL